MRTLVANGRKKIILLINILQLKALLMNIY